MTGSAPPHKRLSIHQALPELVDEARFPDTRLSDEPDDLALPALGSFEEGLRYELPG